MMLTLDKAAYLIVDLVAKTGNIDRPSLEREWSSVLMHAAVVGELKMHDAATRMPIRSAKQGAIVHMASRGVTSVQEIHRWFSDKGIDLVLTEVAESRPRARRLTLNHPEVLGYAEQLMNDWANKHFTETDTVAPREQVIKAILKDLNAHFGKRWAMSSLRRHLLPEWTFVPFARNAQKAQNNTT